MVAIWASVNLDFRIRNPSGATKGYFSTVPLEEEESTMDMLLQRTSAYRRMTG
jgi:hypothetical protein